MRLGYFYLQYLVNIRVFDADPAVSESMPNLALVRRNGRLGPALGMSRLGKPKDCFNRPCEAGAVLLHHARIREHRRDARKPGEDLSPAISTARAVCRDGVSPLDECFRFSAA